MDAAVGAARDTRAATVCWRLLIASALVADVGLERRRLGLLTDVARTRPGVAARIVLELHFLGWLGPLDPFRLIGMAARADAWKRLFARCHVP